jgi:hypothetical protein
MLDDPFGDGDMEVDYGDVLVLRGVIKIVIAIIALQQGYELDFDTDMTFNDPMVTIQTFLFDHMSFLSLAEGQTQFGEFGEVEAQIDAALADFEAAVASITMEPDSGAGQDNDFIRIDDPVEAQALVDNVKMVWESKITPPGSDGVFFRIDRFLDGVDFRGPPNLLPPFVGDTPGEYPFEYPDPTFNDVVSLPPM